MNFLLKDIELIIDDFFVEKAEILLESSRLGNMVEIDNNLWIGLVVDGQRYEIEVQLQNKKVKAYTCECTTYKEDKICQHIVAGLLLLRKKNPYVPTQDKSTKVKKTPKKLTVLTILAETPDDELKSFVRQYARHNRKFALDLKTRFIGYVSSMENEEKYNLLLETALNGVFRSYNEINRSGMDHLLKVYEELYVQIEEHIAMKNYREAIDIMSSLFKGLPSLLRRKGRHRDVLFPLIRDLCSTSTELFSSKMSPDLHQRLWEILFNQAQETIYCHLSFEKPIFRILTEKCTKTRFETFQTVVEDLIDFFSNNLSIKANLIQYLYKVVIKNKEDSNLFCEKYLDDPYVLEIVISNFISTDSFKDAKRLAKLGLKMKSQEILPFLERSLLDMAIASDHKKEVIKYATSRFLATYKIEYYDILKEHADDIEKHTNNLIESLNLNHKGFLTNQLIIKLRLEIDDFDNVIELLKNTSNLKLIMEFDEFLYQNKQKALMGIYLNWIDEYLKEHFGPAPTKKIQSIVQHLYAIKADKFARQLVHNILETYPKRQFLNKTLMVF